MVAFARTRAKSIFSRLRLKTEAKRYIETNEKKKNDVLSVQAQKDSNVFLEAIKNGGIWLS